MNIERNIVPVPNWVIFTGLFFFLVFASKFDHDFLTPIALLAFLGFTLFWWLRTINRNEPQSLEVELKDAAFAATDNSSYVVPGECPYSILGVDSKASGLDIRRAYRSCAKQNHPDHFPPEQKKKASDELIRIHRAYEIIGDLYTRFDYDLYVKSCWPFFPSLDDAYRFIEERHQLVREVFEDLALERKMAQQSNPQTISPPGEQEEESPVSVSAPQTHALSNLPASGAKSAEPTSGSPLPSSECPSCGEPIQVEGGRSGLVHCGRCGQELT